MSKEKEYKIEILMKTIKNQEAIRGALNPMIESVDGIAKSDPEIKDKIEKVKEKYFDDIIPSTISKLIDSFFSEEDLDACINFFSSESGRKLLNSEYQKNNQKTLTEISGDMHQELLTILQPYLPKHPIPPNANA